MALGKESKATADIAMTFILDGQSLDLALAKAEKMALLSEKRKNKMTEAEALKVRKYLETQQKKSLNRMFIAFNKFIKKITKLEEAEDKKSLRKKEARAKKSWNNRVRARLARIKKMQADRAAIERKAELTRERRHKRELKRRYARFVAYLKKKNAVEDASNAKQSSKSGYRPRTFTGAFQAFPNKIGTVAAYTGAIVAIQAVIQSLRFAIEKTIEFEKAFTDLEVKSGYTTKQMASVSEAIYEVAASTKFMTTDIVEAATSLGKLGFEAEEVISILPNVAAVAGATGSSLDEVSKIFGKVLNAYSLQAEQAQFVADLMVDTFNNSALDIEKFNTAFSYVGAAAASTGTSLTELTKSMAILSDRGITASKIGTGLRNIFTKLGREGDTLRDIIARINKENLSFYEIAELVGRRAANQLFVLMDSIDEFDSAVAESVNSFGSAWEANAKQMDTFSAKWDIFINNITNSIAGLEFDPDETFRASLNESIDLMTRLNALKLFNQEGADIAVFNQAAKSKEFLKSLSEGEKLSRAKGLSGEELEKDIIQTMIQEVLSGIDDEAVKEIVSGFSKGRQGASGLDFQKLELADPEIRAIASQKIDEIQGLLKFLDLSDGDSLLKAIARYDAGVKEAEVSAGKAQFVSDLESITSFISQFDAKTVNAFNDALKGGDGEGARAVVKQLIDEGLATKEQMKRLNSVLDASEYLTDELKEKIRNKSLDSALGAEIKEGQGYTKMIGKLSGGTYSIDGVMKDSRKRFNEFVEKRKAWESEMCTKAKTDQAYRFVLEQEGVICDKERASRERGEIARIDRFESDRQAYRVTNDRLQKEFSSAKGDPQEQLRINNTLLANEDIFQDKMVLKYEAYLERMIAEREEFIRKFPKQQVEYDQNITNTQNQLTKFKADREIKRNTYDNRDVELKVQRWKKESDAREDYLVEMARLENEYQGEKSYRKREDIINKQNALSEQFYKDEIARVNEYYDEIDQLIADAEAFNEIQKALGGPLIDLTDAKEMAGRRSTDVKKIGTESEKAKREQKDKDDWQDVDWTATAMSVVDSVHDIYKDLGALKLELLQEQTERELDLIKERFDKEKSIRDSALESGIISQKDAIAAEERARKKMIDKENAAKKKLFDATQKQQKQDAIIGGLISIAKATALAFATNLPPVAALMAAIAAASISASTAVQLKGINQRKFIPKKYAEGGLVEGRSHAQGGVPFTVSGRGGYEMEGGEYIVNKEATKKHLAQLEAINGKVSRSTTHFASGGRVDNVNEANIVTEELIEVLSRPVRAFVTDQDLAESQSEREALTKKVSY